MSAASPRVRPLRIKLTLWYLLVFSFIQIALTSAVLYLRRGSIDRWHEDRQAASAADLIENVLVAEPEEWSAALIESLVPVDSGFVACAVRDEAGGLLAAWGLADEAALRFTPEERRPSGAFQPAFRIVPAAEARELIGPLIAGSELRLLTLPFRFRDEVHYLQALERPSLSFGPYYELIAFGLPVGLIAALFASWLIAGRAVAPIQKLSFAAKSVSSANLGDRLQVRSTDDEITVLQEELNQILQRMEERFRAQESFISNVSHELKTPIAVLLTDSQVLRIGGESRARYRRFARRVEKEMQRLAQLVESFLMLARSDLAKGPTLLQPVSINDLVLDSIQRCSAPALRRSVRLVPQLVSPDENPVEPLVVGDAELLLTMLNNIIRNAIRHSPRGARVDVDTSSSEGRVRVAVRDRGPGIPDEYREQVFERLVRVPGARSGSEGRGLGLAITRNIARLHEGEVSVSNLADGGCVFVVSLPLGKEPGAQDEEAPSTAGRPASAR